MQNAVASGVPQPTDVELKALQEMLGKMGKGADDGGGVQLSDAGGEGDGPVGPEGPPGVPGSPCGPVAPAGPLGP